MSAKINTTNPRRAFLGKIAAGAALGVGSFASPLQAAANVFSSEIPNADPDAWFAQIKGKHRMIFDVTKPNGLFPFAWPKIFLLTNQATGTSEKENSVVVVLRHEAIAYAFEDRIWSSYKFGEMFKADDPLTKAPAVRNPFWKPKPGDFKVPGVGPVDIGIDQLQASGVMFCVCNMALTVNSAVAAMQMNQDPATVKKDWMDGLLPGVQVVPSGVWAVGRAQEHGCAYCYV